MTTEVLYEELNYINHSRENRLKYANLIIDNPSLIPKLLDILFRVDDKRSCRAAFLLELVAKENLDSVLPHLDRITKHLHKVHLDSAVRPLAKICEILVIAYYSKKENEIKKLFSPIYKERIIEVCFDWMITDQKVAVLAYSMSSLYLLGQDYN